MWCQSNSESTRSCAADCWSSGAALPARRVRTEDGGMQTIYTVDAHSATVGEDILALFRLNVARARRETREAMKHRGIAAE